MSCFCLFVYLFVFFFKVTRVHSAVSFCLHFFLSNFLSTSHKTVQRALLQHELEICQRECFKKNKIYLYTCVYIYRNFIPFIKQTGLTCFSVYFSCSNYAVVCSDSRLLAVINLTDVYSVLGETVTFLNHF